MLSPARHMPPDHQSNRILWGSMLVSLLLSLVVFQRAALINNDGILYVRSALFFSQGAWAKGLETYNWPLYSLLIAAAHRLLDIGLEQAAQVINAALDALTVGVFVALLRQLGGDRTTLLWGAALILALPFFNDNRGELIRGHGYWAFYLLSLLLLLGYCQQPTRIKALGWALASVSAALFRIEGLLLVITMPLLLLLEPAQPIRARLGRTLMLAAPLLVLGGVTLVILLSSGQPLAEVSGRLSDPFSLAADFWRSVTQGLPAKARIFAAQVLPTYSQEYATAGLILLLLWILLAHVLEALSPVYLLLTAFAARMARPPGFGGGVYWLLAGLVALQLIILGVSLTTHFYLSARFALPLVLTLLLPLAFMLRDLSAQKPRWRPWLLLLLAIAAADGLITLGDHRRDHVREAAAWLDQRANPQTQVLSNFERLDYYTNRQRPPEQWIPFHFLRPEVGQTQTPARIDLIAIVQQGDQTPPPFRPLLHQARQLARFGGDRGEQILIYAPGPS